MKNINITENSIKKLIERRNLHAELHQQKGKAIVIEKKSKPEDEQENKERIKNEKYLESKSLDDIKALEMQLDDLIEKRSFMLISPTTKKTLEEKESKINAERKQLKHDRNKEAEEQEAERRNKKNMENIKKLSEMIVFKGHPTMNRRAKPKVKKIDDTNKNKDARDEDFKRYVRDSI